MGMAEKDLADRNESVQKASQDSTELVKNWTFTRSLIVVKKVWFDSFIGTDMGIISEYYILEVVRNF